VRHPEAARHGGHCAACLLEDALMDPSPVDAGETLTIQLPLGASARAFVFLVTQDGPPVRLLRLKTWRCPAPGDFMERFERLRQQMTGWPHEAIPAAETAWVGPSGRPSILSEFRRGLPLLEQVECGRLDAAAAEACLASLRATVRSAHERGLVHGSIAGGNILIADGSHPASLLDFGCAALVGDGDAAPTPSADGAAFDLLADAVRTLASSARSRA
jgi:serine/threonine protein kinase